MEAVAALWRHYLVHVVDILLVSFILFHLLILIRGTRAVQIAVGIFVVGLMTLLAQLLGLPTLTWLLQKFWIAGVVVLAVLFQPEIRSALARLGMKTAPRSHVHEEMEAVNELVAAVKEAARRQMGMLIVCERESGLRNYVESGTVVNADISRELLLTIFQPPAVLHDGAVILQGNRIMCAGAILPLSSDPTLSKWLGTRHRAAVGISERSDAWSVCVSEETGNISVAESGKLTQVENPDELRQMLINFYQYPLKKEASSHVPSPQ